jgi:hypothetical protein
MQACPKQVTSREDAVAIFDEALNSTRTKYSEEVWMENFGNDVNHIISFRYYAGIRHL